MLPKASDLGPAANTRVYATDRPRGARGPHHEPADVPVPVAGGGALPAHAADVRLAGRRHQPAPPAEHQVTRLHIHMGSDGFSSILGIILPSIRLDNRRNTAYESTI